MSLGLGEPDSTRPAMQYEAFRSLVSSLTADISARRLDAALAEHLTRHHPPGGEMYDKIRAACHDAIAAGWMCNREADGIRYGRVIKPGPETHGFSVDVVDMQDCAGPHHVHPNGEIDLVMPLDGRAALDGQGAGWKVYEAGSDHFPTVRGGRALVLYLLPGGAIQFTGRQPKVIG
jgi:hypothetical protein